MKEDQVLKILGDEYKPIKLLGQGTFGTIYSVQSKKDLQIYACKIESSHQKVYYLIKQKIILVQKEWNILYEFSDYPEFPKVYFLQKLKENSYLIMEMFDKNLEQIFIISHKKFTIQTVALLTIEILSITHKLH